eukprot:gene24954-42102_t
MVFDGLVKQQEDRDAERAELQKLHAEERARRIEAQARAAEATAAAAAAMPPVAAAPAAPAAAAPAQLHQDLLPSLDARIQTAIASALSKQPPIPTKSDIDATVSSALASAMT